MCYIFRSCTLPEEAFSQHYHTLTMNGYLNESNFMMVEEGFSTRDLLENILVELCQAVRAGGSRHPDRGGRGEVTTAHSGFLLE